MLRGLEREEVYSKLRAMLTKQKYHFVGRHTTVKKCYWNHAALVENRFCYKCKFYGIESHRCIQMSPATFWCWNACLHCWRLRPQDIGIDWDETRMPYADDPAKIVEGMIREWRRLVSGYKGHPRVDPRMLEEALEPKHVAISLTGEPTLYPYFNDFLREIHKRGMTSFLVTRGIRPDVLEKLDEEPSQTYLSLEAWDKKSYEYFNKPLAPRAWELTLKTMDLFRTMKNPTVYRITLVKGFNTSDEALRSLAKLVERGQPTYVELKSYMYVGASRERLSRENMLSHEEVRQIAEKFSELTGYPVRAESRPSRVVLLTPLKKPIRHGKGCPRGWETPDYPGESEYNSKNPEVRL